MNVYVFVVPLETHVDPLSLLNSYFVIPDSESLHVAVTVALSVFIFPIAILAVGAEVSILDTVNVDADATFPAASVVFAYTFPLALNVQSFVVPLVTSTHVEPSKL